MLEFNQSRVRNAVILVLFTFSSLLNFKFDGREFFLWLQIVFCVYMAFTTKTVVLLQDKGINAWFISIILCTCGALFSGMPASWVKAAVVMAIYMIPFYFTLSYLLSLIKEDPNVLRVVIKGLKAMCVIQLMWIPLQYIAYHYLDLDLNKLLFYDVFNMTATENGATFIRDWRYYPSGMTWHSAILGPTFLLALILCKNPLVKCLAVFDVLICGNSTALVCVLLCLCLQVTTCIYRRDIKIKKNQFIVLVAMLGVFVVGCVFDIFPVPTAILRLAVRLLDTNSDASTAAHFAYFTDYPKIVKEIPLFQILFGTGIGSSGYQYSLLYNRYTNLANWAVECDVINILVSKGILGLLVNYGFLIYIVFQGSKLDFRYLVFMMPIIVGGIGYNIQFDYVIMFEMLLYFSIKQKINLFAIND